MTTITVDRELLEQALAALDAGHQFGSNHDLVAALSAALAQPDKRLTDDGIQRAAYEMSCSNGWRPTGDIGGSNLPDLYVFTREGISKFARSIEAAIRGMK